MTPQLPTHILGLDPDALRARFQEGGAVVEPFRADQVLQWVYRRRVVSFEDMTDLPADLRCSLAQRYAIWCAEVKQHCVAADGTHKLLLHWPEGGTTECVLIPSGARMTACVSTQVGCPVKCAFCASGVGGLERNLTAGQIVEQALRLSEVCAQQDRRLSNVVFMGLGEPLANYAATRAAAGTINAAWGMGLAARKITISTVGLPSQMRRLADERLQITLALSLHAPDDDLRRQLIPWAERVTVAELIDACRYYFERTGREVTLEYILLDGVNNLPQHARRLGEVSKKMRSNVNLIPYNPVPDLPFRRPSPESVRRFAEDLRRAGVNTHVRHSRGLDVDAACGQLRRRAAENRNE